MISTSNHRKEKKMRFGRILAVQAFCVMPLLWAATASADFVETVPLSKGQSYQKPNKAGKEKGIFAWSATLAIETSEGSQADVSCHVSAIGTALFDGTNMCAWGNIEVVGTGALCPALPETALVDFAGPYTVNLDGSIMADMKALGGLAPTKLLLLPSVGTGDNAVFSCQDKNPGTDPANKSWVVCAGSATRINKAPKDANKQPLKCPLP
jgi:hypothetical protein